MSRNLITFSIQEAGGLLYVADSDFGGYPINEFHEFFGGREGLQGLTENGAVIAGTLYQDDGYNVRVVFGDLSDEESSQWTSRIDGKIDLSTGKLLVAGICDEELEDNIAEFTQAADGSDCELGAIVHVEPGTYSVSIYSYPPNDLAGGWMRLSDKGYFKSTLADQLGVAFEAPDAYFTRTRPGESIPRWIEEGWDDKDFLNFVVQLTPYSGTVSEMDFEEDGCLRWKYRKPEECPVGIILDS